MDIENKVILEFSALSENEALARNVAGLFAIQFSPTISQISDIKTAVSEAVTNSIVHGYPDKKGSIIMELIRLNNELHINVIDHGIGIKDVSLALEPFFTTKEEEERSGMGFTIMKTFMDEVKVVSKKGCGTKVYMAKKIKTNA